MPSKTTPKVRAVSCAVVDRGVRLGNREYDTALRCDVHDPFTGRLVGTVGQASADQAERAVSIAHDTLRQNLPAHERAAILDRVAVTLTGRREEIAALICAEVAKPISMARGEVDRAIDTFRLSAAVARLSAGSVVAMDATAAGAGKIAFTQNLPIGVVTAITPFNFPLNLVAHKLAPALAAGCPVVLKPAPQAPLTAFALADVLESAGLPAGWLSVVPGSPEEIGQVIIEDQRVAAISFTGSVPVGRHIASRATGKKVLLELGNASPAIVDADADIELAASVLAPNAFGFAGQTCVSVQRVYVHESVRDLLLDRLIATTERLGVGDPTSDDVVCGPVIDDRTAEKTLATLSEAVAAGACVRTGGLRRSDGVLLPTVISDAPQNSALMQNEAFAPVMGVATFDNIETAISMANDSAYGLQASVFTSDITRALTVMNALDFGAVLVNESPSFRTDNMPYGGIRDSGNTKEGPEWTASELTIEKLCIIAQ
ncbi:aldehyde dehydrogenase family protein [Rhodococcus sp. 114MFTsu3.1]|uniref:aldehyde dehydrogenase family protein n=1 Tax=Rhodococcus sp. 114MFTsu3.1 TaxID=1172184 RepID=UPI0003A32C29|nr:aldehyde dehydrogenase family protein [Rhodococcus sp. 114MFTsu3.1]